METGKGDRITPKIGEMRINGLVAGVILVVLGALLMAEGIVTKVGNALFMFAENMNQGFEFVVGFVTIVLAAKIMDLSRSQLTMQTALCLSSMHKLFLSPDIRHPP